MSDVETSAPEPSSELTRHEDPEIIQLDRELDDAARLHRLHEGFKKHGTYSEAEDEAEDTVPAEKPSRDQSGLVEDPELARRDEAIYAAHGTSLGELAEIARESPQLLRYINPEPNSDEELAKNVQLLQELAAGREARSELAQTESQEWLDYSTEQLEESLEDWERHALASELAINAPEKLGEFMEAWAQDEPEEASRFYQSRMQQHQQEQQNLAQLKAAMQYAQIAEEMKQRSQQVTAAIEDELRRLKGRVNENNLRLLGPQMMSDLSDPEIIGTLETPEDARAAVQMSYARAMEMRKAEEDARVLTEIDEAIHNSNASPPGGFQTFDAEQKGSQNFGEVINSESALTRIIAPAEKTYGKPKPGWLQEMDLWLDGEKALTDIGR